MTNVTEFIFVIIFFFVIFIGGYYLTGERCPYCKSRKIKHIYEHKDGLMYQCKVCRKKFSVETWN